MQRSSDLEEWHGGQFHHDIVIPVVSRYPDRRKAYTGSYLDGIQEMVLGLPTLHLQDVAFDRLGTLVRVCTM